MSTGDMSSQPGEGPRPLAESLERLLGAMAAPPIGVLSTLFTQWAGIVGEDLARHCRPAAAEGARLLVVAVDPAWASEIQWLEQTVLDRLEEALGQRRFTELLVSVERRSQG